MYRQVIAPLILLLVGLPFGLATFGAVQEPVPVTGTIALEGTVDKTYAAANTVIVKATDGVEHLFHLTRRTVVHGAKDTGDAALSGLKEGSRIVVHYAADGEQKTAVEVDRVGDDGQLLVRPNRSPRTNLRCFLAGNVWISDSSSCG